MGQSRPKPITELAAPWHWDRRDQTGPFDLIGDVHGCMEELVELLGLLGYEIPGWQVHDEALITASHPEGRRILFVGDLCDRGPMNVPVLRLVMGSIKAGSAIMVLGNHDDRLRRYLKGNQVTLNHGLEGTAAELEAYSDPFCQSVLDFLEDQNHYIVLEGGDLCITHAGIQPRMVSNSSDKIRAYCLYGPRDGYDEQGFPIRYDWAKDHDGKLAIVYGHTPNRPIRWRNNTLNLDGGCVFGGGLYACRLPEREIVSVPAKRTYYQRSNFVELPDL